ncbi:hypothetical protein GGI03_000564 [Coemansia sp. RSA 2337]|nr:hypothetical protein H4S04_000812 [Coemansia sp. S16]KAJ2069836.1 hypothetical protein GGI08_000143 [Coemansia sp. S2]KAJ2075390.1 hypothetical protein GGH13_000644 [Coemansia sp. S155-1]KAJ2115517.1 hypothetical protein IW146_002249 [Coemansia sp. RSA 922]KAJ2469127.1 hypothetical protein GGI03_000564 [Coemansia sp. RSA 2337]
MAIIDKAYLAINALYILVRFVLQYRSINWTETILYLATVAIESFLYLNLYKVSRPRYDPGGILIDSGTDLSQPGLVSYMFDYIYVSWLVHLLSLLTKWAWCLYLAIPVYLAYAFGPYVLQFIRSQSGTAAAGPASAAAAEGDSEKDKKRQEKKERKQQRVKYSR